MSDRAPTERSEDTRLTELLAGLDARRRPGSYTLLEADPRFDDDEIEALLREDEGVSVVVSVDAAARLGKDVSFRAAWLTLGVASDVTDVGLTAAVSSALARASIPCNVLAGLHHDHLLVPDDEATRALAILDQLRTSASS